MTEDMNRSAADQGSELDSLLGAYALDALDDVERRRVDEYLQVNPRAADEVRQHREVATMLAFTGGDAPEGVWARIEGEIEATAPDPGPTLTRAFGQERPQPIESIEARRADRMRRPSMWLAAAAAAAALIVAGFFVAGIADESGDDLLADAYAAASADRDSIRAELVAEGSDAVAIGLVDQDGHGYLDATSLPTLRVDQTYQLWGVIAATGDVVSLGILGRQPELETFTVESEIEALAVTIEDAPGVISDGNAEGAFTGSF